MNAQDFQKLNQELDGLRVQLAESSVDLGMAWRGETERPDRDSLVELELMRGTILDMYLDKYFQSQRVFQEGLDDV